MTAQPESPFGGTGFFGDLTFHLGSVPPAPPPSCSASTPGGPCTLPQGLGSPFPAPPPAVLLTHPVLLHMLFLGALTMGPVWIGARGQDPPALILPRSAPTLQVLPVAFPGRSG